MNNKINESIRCEVESCTHHCESRDFCCLDTITVGCDCDMASCDTQTDCKSFECKK